MQLTVKGLCVTGLVGLLAGCGFFGMDPLKPRLQITDPEAVKKADDFEICGAYGATGGVSRSTIFGVNQYEITKAELKRRQTFTEEEWTQINNHEVVIGMSKCAVLAAIGGPQYNYPQKHQHLGDNIKDNEWRYNFNWYQGTGLIDNLGPGTYVYFQNDRVIKIEGEKHRYDRGFLGL